MEGRPGLTEGVERALKQLIAGGDDFLVSLVSAGNRHEVDHLAHRGNVTSLDVALHDAAAGGSKRGFVSGRQKDTTAERLQFLRVGKSTDREGVDDLAGLTDLAISIDRDRAASLQSDRRATDPRARVSYPTSPRCDQHARTIGRRG